MRVVVSDASVAPPFNQPSLVGPHSTVFRGAITTDRHNLYAPFLYAPFMNREDNTSCFFMAIGDIQGRASDSRDRVPGKIPGCLKRCCFGLSEAQMFIMALMLFVIVVSYFLMFGLVKFAENVIDRALPANLRDAIPSDTNAKARSL
jgi:hypothetical protein